MQVRTAHKGDHASYVDVLRHAWRVAHVLLQNYEFTLLLFENYEFTILLPQHGAKSSNGLQNVLQRVWSHKRSAKNSSDSLINNFM